MPGNNPGSAVVRINVKLARLLLMRHRPGFDPPWNQSSWSDDHLGRVPLGITLSCPFLFFLSSTIWGQKVENRWYISFGTFTWGTVQSCLVARTTSEESDFHSAGVTLDHLHLPNRLLTRRLHTPTIALKPHDREIWVQKVLCIKRSTWWWRSRGMVNVKIRLELK